MGDSGELTALDVWFHRPMFLTETAWCHGMVAEIHPDGRVHIDLELTTFDDELLSTGVAQVNLPTR